MKDSVSIVVLGAGRMGKNHLRVIQEDPCFKLEAVVDPRIDDLPLPATGNARRLKRIEDLAGVNYSAAVIAVPTGLHHDIALGLISQGKHVLVEKPLADTYARCLELETLAKKKQVTLAVGHVERFNPAVRKLREVIECGYLGEVMHIAFTRVGGYPDDVQHNNNALLDLAVHDIDVLNYLNLPMDVVASLCRCIWKKDIMDTVEILLSNKKGVAASIHANWVTPTKIRSIRVTGTRGVCFVDYILQTCYLLGGNLLKSRTAPENDFQTLVDEYRNSDRIDFGVRKREPLKAQLGEFHKAVKGQPSEVCTGADAAQVLAVVEQAMKASR